MKLNEVHMLPVAYFTSRLWKSSLVLKNSTLRVEVDPATLRLPDGHFNQPG